MAGGRNSISLYRQMMRMAKAVPEAPRRVKALQDLRAAFRDNRAATAQEVDDLWQAAEERMRYFRMLIPRRDLERIKALSGQGPGEGAGEAQHFVVRDGRVVEGHAAAASGAQHTQFGAGNLDPDSLARHQHQIRRMQFADRPTKPLGPVW